MDVSKLIERLRFNGGGIKDNIWNAAADALTAERERADKAEDDKLELRARWMNALARADDLTRKLGEAEERFAETWPKWATQILDMLVEYGFTPDDEVDLPQEVANWLSEFDPQDHKARVEAERKLAEAEEECIQYRTSIALHEVEEARWTRIALEHERDDLTRKLAEAVEVVRPFAALLENVFQNMPDEVAISHAALGDEPSVGDCRRARAFIQKQEAASSQETYRAAIRESE